MKCPNGKEPRANPLNNEDIGMELITGHTVYCDPYFECPNGIVSFPDSQTWSNCGQNDNKSKFRLNFDELFESAYLCCEDVKSCQITQSSYKFLTNDENEYGLTKSLLPNQENNGYIHQVIKNGGKQRFLCSIPIGKIWLEIYKPVENQQIPKEYLPVDFLNMDQEKSLKSCEKNIDCKGSNQFCGEYTSFAKEDGNLKFCYKNPKILISNISKSFQISIDSQEAGLKLCDSNEDCLKNDRICWKNWETDKKWNGKSGICIEKKPVAFVYSRIFEDDSKDHFYFAVELENEWKNRDLLRKCEKNEDCDIENGQFCDNIVGINGEKDMEKKYCFKTLKSPSPHIKPTIIGSSSGLILCQNCELPSFCHSEKDLGICWKSQNCADQQTALFLEPKCQNNEDCQKNQIDSNCQNEHCCPSAKLESDGTFSAPKHHYITQRPCNSSYNFQINFPNSFCDPKSLKIVVIGKYSKHGEKLKLSSNSKNCEKNIDCDKENREVCIFDGKIGNCYYNPLTYKGPPEDFPILAVIIPIIIIIIILILIAGGYLIYKKKINKDEKSEKKSKKKSVSTPKTPNV